jgi:small-conductance mechanosensitive channel
VSVLALGARVTESSLLVRYRMTRVFRREVSKSASLGLLLGGLLWAGSLFGQVPRLTVEVPPPPAVPSASAPPSAAPAARASTPPKLLAPSGSAVTPLPAPSVSSAAAVAPSAAPLGSAEPVPSVDAAASADVPPSPPPPTPSVVEPAPEPAPAVAPAEPLEPPPPPEPAPVPAFPVKLSDDSVFALRASLGGKSPEQRARDASAQLKRAYEGEQSSDVTVVRRGDVALLSVGRTFIVELSEEEAKLAGTSSLEAYAASTASAIHEKLVSDHKRAAIAKSAFSFSLVVFFGLIAFYLIRKLGEFAERARHFIEVRSDKDLSLRFQGIEFVRPAMVRSAGVLGLSTLKWLAQFGVAYTWLVVVLSLFESTRDYTQKLTGFVLAPLSQLMARLATALPLLVVAALAALAVFVLLRFVGLFFASVARGETPLGWLPNDLAAPTSVLLRSGIVISALVFLAPIVTGDNDGVLGRVGVIALVALGLASTPVLASGTVGAIWLYGRRLRVGEYVELGAYRGRVSELNLLELRLTVTDRTELRVPHLLTLVRPLRLLGARPRLTLDVYVHASSSVTEVRSLLAAVAGKVGAEPSVEIVSADADAIRFRIAATCESLDARTAFHIAALDALSSAGITLGRDRA